MSFKRLKFFMTLQKPYIFHLLIKREEEGSLQYGNIVQLLSGALPAQPALTETLEIQLWENFTVCPDILQFPVQIHTFSLKMETVKIF